MDAVGEVARESGGDGIEVVVLKGEHDLGTLPLVQDAFEAATGEEMALVIDLSPATFVDSSILGAVLEVTGLAEELPVHPTREAALEALAAAPT